MLIYTLIPTLPLAASLLLLMAGRRLEGKGHRIVIPAVAASFVLSLLAFTQVQAQGAIELDLYQLFAVGDLVVDFGFYIDPLTVLILLLVTGVSSIVQVYAGRYMIGDRRHSRFFALTALFTAAMTFLVMSNNLLVTFIFWEVMGFCSYLLIAHYADRPSAIRAATKVFLVNSIADVGLSIGVILAFRNFGTLDIPEILALARSGAEFSPTAMTVMSLCLFMGAVGKSAQMPAHVWLPLAMEAPTPVSALIHAATMVNAGPFLLIRLSPVLVLSPSAMTVIAIVGGLTALFAAIVSLTQSDIKRSLAYSTMSQLGFMILLCGVGAFVAAIFHLIAHGFFKAFLFLSTGNSLAATKRRFAEHPEPPVPATQGLYIAALVLALLPPLVIFSARYQHLWLSQNFSAATTLFWVVGLSTVFCTAIYVFKCINEVFRHSPAGPASGDSWVRPQFFHRRYLVGVALALGLWIALLLAIWRWFVSYLSPYVGAAPMAVETSPGAGPALWVAMAVALLGWGLAWLHRNHTPAPNATNWNKRLYVFFLNKAYFDELYEAAIVRPSLAFAHWGWRVIDRGLIDRFVLSVAPGSVAVAAWIARRIDRDIIDRQVESVGAGSVGMAHKLAEVIDTGALAHSADQVAHSVEETGRQALRYEAHTLQHNLLVVVLLLVAALSFFYWFS